MAAESELQVRTQKLPYSIGTRNGDPEARFPLPVPMTVR